MFFRATIRRLFPVACAAVMLCAPTVAHVPRTSVPRIPLQVAQPALTGHGPPNAVAVTGSPVIHADPFLNAATYAITNLFSPAVTSGVAVARYYTDFFGNLRNPTNPCLGAIEVVLDDDGALIINPGVGGLTGWTSVVRDGGGRIIRRTYRGHVQNLAYDGRGRLTAWDWGGSTSNATTYTYDHAGRRVLITETLAGRTTVTRCVYDGADVCTDFVDTNNDGVVDRTRVYWLLPGMDRRIGFADITNGVATFYYYLTDQVGTVLQIVDDAGTVVNQYDYDAWGNVRWGGSNTFEHVENRYLFQGREWDRNGGFYYFRNRIYLPERGEFASPDRNLGRGILGEMDGMGTLVFGGGDPVNRVDPEGLAIQIVAGYLEVSAIVVGYISDVPTAPYRITKVFPTKVWRYSEEKMDWVGLDLSSSAEKQASAYFNTHSAGSSVTMLPRNVPGVAAEKSALLREINIIRETPRGAKLFDYIASDKTPLANLWVGQKVWPFQGRDASGILGIWLMPTENMRKHPDEAFGVVAHEFGHLGQRMAGTRESFPLPEAWIDTHHSDQKYTSFDESLAIRVQNLVAAEYYIKRDRPDAYYYHDLRIRYPNKGDEGDVYLPLPSEIKSHISGLPSYNERASWHYRNNLHTPRMYSWPRKGNQP